ncbi:MAG: phosphoribosylanthranilate isomerase [Acidobacteria bacterium]|nr:MAG: phosphoribosylanthranilate isomerase [Acidobacteriota bacterium]
MVKVKICGITNLPDAVSAIELGADALGFNLYKKSSRYIEPSQAKPIVEALPPLVSLVGIFVDEYSPDRVMKISHAIGISSVQLHGSESPEYVRKLSELRVIKAFRVDKNFELKQLEVYSANAYLLDAHVPGQLGGTGKAFKWDVAIAAKRHGRVILAGGLTPENIYEAICNVEPYAVDICSGVEIEPGRKDVKKMEALFREIGRARQVLTRASAE